MPLKRFVLVTLDYPPEIGGVARYLSELVREAAGDIRVIVPEKHDTDGPGEVQSQSFFRKRKPVWWPIVNIMRNQVASDEQVLVSHVFPIGMAAWIARQLGGPTYRVIFHGLDLKLAASSWKRFWLRRICRSAEGLYVNSQVTAKLLQERCAPMQIQSEILTPGIRSRQLPSKQEARKRLGVDAEAKIVLTVSRFVPRKGIDVTIQAMAEIQAQQPVKYVVIGSGTDRGRLESMAQQAGTQVTWISADEEQKWDWFSACDVFCMPARETADDIEGFGIVYLEAALAGKPAIAGNAGGAMEAVINGETGILVDPTNASAVRAEISRLLADPALAERIGKTAQLRVQSAFDWKERWQSLKQHLV